MLVLSCCSRRTGATQVYCSGCTMEMFGHAGGISCPVEGCRRAVQLPDVYRMLPDPSKIAEMMHKSIDRDRDRDSEIIAAACPSVSCVDAKGRRGRMLILRGHGTFGVCLNCDKVSCSVCHGDLEAHAGRRRPCRPRGGATSADVKSVAQAMDGACKRCPKCMTGIERKDGCNTVACTECRWYFCWLCGEVLVHQTSPGAFDRAHDHFNEDENEHCTGLLFGGEQEFTRRSGRPPYTGMDPGAERSDGDSEHE